MIRRGSEKSVPDEHWRGRRDNARAFHEAARLQLALLDAASNANPVISLVASAAIGYADAVTSRRRGVVNQDKHEQVVTTLRGAVGARLPPLVARALTSIIKEKATSQYGVRHGRTETATRLLALLDEVAQWSELELARS